jgi:tetratricopeptide (TPR) repeat protein
MTPEFGAFQRWFEGQELYRQARHSEAILAYREAIAIDPELAPAWIWMGVAYQLIGISDSARWAIDQGLSLPHRLVGFQRLAADYADPWQRGGSAPELLRISERMVEETSDPGPLNNLALAYANLGRWDESVRIGMELEERLPFGLPPVAATNLLSWLTGIGELEEARARASALQSRVSRLGHERVIASSAGDFLEAERKALVLLGDPEAHSRERSRALREYAGASAAQGRVREAFLALRRSSEVMGEVGGPPRTQSVLLLTLSFASGVTPEDFGLSPIPLDTLGQGKPLTGLWHLQLREVSEALTLARTVARPDTGASVLIPGTHGPELLFFAWLEREEGDWEAAIEILESQSGHEPWRESRDYRFLVGWTVAEAFDELLMPDSAAVHYGRLANPLGDEGYWAVPWFRGFTHSFAHRRAALAYGQLNRREEAIEHWNAFLDAFTRPDPEFESLVEEARAELARLEG